MHTRGLSLLGVLLLMATAAVQAREVSGVSLPETLHTPRNGELLVLNGAGTVTRFFTPILVAGLYLPQRQDDAASIMALPGTKRVVLHILYDGVTAGDLADVLIDCLRENLDGDSLALLNKHLQSLPAMLVEIGEGDRITIDMDPVHGSSVAVNDEVRGVLEAGTLTRAMLAVWLGDFPADARLKRAMLGG